MRKPSIILVSAWCAMLSICPNFNSFGATVKGSGKIASENRKVSQFDRVAVSGSGHLTIVQGDEEGLTVEADDNLLPLIKSEVSDGLLKIGPEHVNVKPTMEIRYTLHLKNLKDLRLSGSVDADAPSLHADDLHLGSSGACDIKVPRLKAGDIDVQITGAGDIDLAGKAEHQTISISGSGDYRAGDLDSQTVTVRVSGAGDAKIWARQALEAHVSGSGDVAYYGTPQVKSHVSGAGSVSSAGNK